MNLNPSQNYITILDTLSTVQVGQKLDIYYNDKTNKDALEHPEEVIISKSAWGYTNSKLGWIPQLIIRTGNRWVASTGIWTTRVLANRKKDIKWLNKFSQAISDYIERRDLSTKDMISIFESLQRAKKGIENLKKTYIQEKSEDFTKEIEQAEEYLKYAEIFLKGTIGPLLDQLSMPSLSLNNLQNSLILSTSMAFGTNQAIAPFPMSIPSIITSTSTTTSTSQTTEQTTTPVTTTTTTSTFEPNPGPVPTTTASTSQTPISDAPPASIGGPLPPPPPPPPPPSSKSPAKPLKFQDEPDPLSFQHNQYNNLTEQELNDQIEAIKTYLIALESSLQPIQALLTEIKQLETVLQGDMEELLDKKAIFKALKASLKELTNLEKISYEEDLLDYKENNQVVSRFTKDNDQPVYYYPDKQFDELKATKNLLEIQKKSVAIALNYERAKINFDHIQSLKKRIAELNEEIGILKKTISGDFKFDEFEKMLKRKNEEVVKWRTAINNRQKKVARLLAGDLTASVIPTKEKKDKSNSDNLEYSQNFLIVQKKATQNPEEYFLMQKSHVKKKEDKKDKEKEDKKD